MIRIVFTADNHLNRYYAKMSPDQLARRRHYIRQAWAQTVDFAIRERADFYLHGGDLFDSPNPRTTELIWAARQFQRLKDAGIPSYAIGGNHDMPKMRTEGSTPQRLYDEVRVTRFFSRVTEVEWAVHEVDGLTVAIGGLSPDPRLGPEDDPLEGVEINPPDADVVLLMLHYAVEGAIHPEANEPVLTKAQLAELKGVDFLLMGHLHEQEEMQVGELRVVFSGPTERMTFGEIDVQPGFIELRLEGPRPLRTRVRRRAIEAQPMRCIEVRTTDLLAHDPAEYLFQRVREVSHPEQLLQCRVVGPLARDAYHRLRFFDVWRLGNELNFFFDLDRSQVTIQDPQVVDVRTAGERVSMRQEIEAVADALAAQANDARERELIEEARALVRERLGI